MVSTRSKSTKSKIMENGSRAVKRRSCLHASGLIRTNKEENRHYIKMDRMGYETMKTTVTREYVAYAGQVGIVLVSLYLLYAVGMDFYLYDVECSDGSDDARWTIPKESWDYESTIGLFWWGFYLLVTGFHLFLYFVRMGNMKRFNMWALPTFNIEGMRILSSILSLFFILFVLFFHTTMPEVFTPCVSRAEYSRMPCYTGIDSFWATMISSKWIVFTLYSTIHLILYKWLKSNG